MTTLKSLVDETTNIKNELVECRDTLKQILIDKKIEDLENENRLSILINKINILEPYDDNVLWLYKRGDERINVSGGFVQGKVKNSYAKFIKNDTSMRLYTTSIATDRISCRTSNKIDLSEYKSFSTKLHAKHNSINYAVSVSLFVSSNGNITTDDSSYVKARVSKDFITCAKDDVLTLDISNIKTSEYLYFEMFVGGDANAYVDFYEIFINK